MAGYSGKPLAAKLGLAPGVRALAVGAPERYRELLGPGADGVVWVSRPGAGGGLGLVHLFVRARRELDRDLARLAAAIRPDGALWVSWPKRASGVATDLTEDRVREAALPLGLVDVKVAAVDEVWSGLKLVWRRSERACVSARR